VRGENGLGCPGACTKSWERHAIVGLRVEHSNPVLSDSVELGRRQGTSVCEIEGGGRSAVA
jgi:hypothetical protein